jgi:hypothetical protein
VACALDAKAVIDGQSRPISLQAFEDGRQICAGANPIDAVHGRVRMTLDPAKRSTEVIVELDVAPNASPNALRDLRGVLVNMSADLDHRVNAAQPIVVQAPPPPVVPLAPPPPPVPMHRVSVTNVPLIAAGGAVFGAGYLVSLFVGTAIVSASGDPGTGRFWPFVPFFGAVAFSASYKEAANCDCDTGRVFSLLGSFIIDAAQIAGVVITLVGVAVPRTKLVPDTVSLHVGPTGFSLEGRF